jgi:hypothetical protein
MKEGREGWIVTYKPLEVERGARRGGRGWQGYETLVALFIYLFSHSVVGLCLVI